MLEHPPRRSHSLSFFLRERGWNLRAVLTLSFSLAEGAGAFSSSSGLLRERGWNFLAVLTLSFFGQKGLEHFPRFLLYYENEVGASSSSFSLSLSLSDRRGWSILLVFCLTTRTRLERSPRRFHSLSLSGRRGWGIFLAFCLLSLTHTLCYEIEAGVFSSSLSLFLSGRIGWSALLVFCHLSFSFSHRTTTYQSRVHLTLIFSFPPIPFYKGGPQQQTAFYFYLTIR